MTDTTQSTHLRSISAITFLRLLPKLQACLCVSQVMLARIVPDIKTVLATPCIRPARAAKSSRIRIAPRSEIAPAALRLTEAVPISNDRFRRCTLESSRASPASGSSGSRRKPGGDGNPPAPGRVWRVDLDKTSQWSSCKNRANAPWLPVSLRGSPAAFPFDEPICYNGASAFDQGPSGPTSGRST